MIRQVISFKFLIMIVACSCSLASSQEKHETSYVRSACSVTHYPDLCIHSLASFSRTAKDSPTRWARAGVSVTISEAKTVSRYLSNLNRTTKTRGSRNRMAISDCVECLQDTLDNLHKSLFVLRKISMGDFTSQMDDVITWMSAALTDEDTCLDGFESFDEMRQKRVSGLRSRVNYVSRMTSNALALVNKLATTGPVDLGHE